MARISSDQIGLRDAADVFGVSIDTLRRRIRDNQLDEALLVQGPFGATWVLPRGAMTTIAERESWEQAAGATPHGAVSRVSEPRHSPVQALASSVQPKTQAAWVPRVEPVDVIDLTAAIEAPPAAVLITAPPDPLPVLAPEVGQGTDDLVLEVTAAVAQELAKGLSDSVQAELSAVRDAITVAEVKAVAADARTDALRAEKGRLEAQLKRAEADIEYWRSQHDRLNRDLDRERGLRVTSDKAKSVAESETRVVRERVVELTVEVSETQSRERVLISTEATLQAELDQATMVMGWWSRRRLIKLQARSSGRTPPSPPGD